MRATGRFRIERTFRAGAARCVLLLALSVLQSCGDGPETSPQLTEEQRAARLARSEELILKLAPGLSKLGEALKVGGAFESIARKQFTPSIDVTAIGEPDQPWNLPIAEVERQNWPVKPDAVAIPPTIFELWKPFRAAHDLTEFSEAHFSIVKGDFDGADETRFEAEVGFEGIAHENDGAVISVVATQSLGWQREAGSGDWQIDTWRQTSFQTIRTPSPLFREVLGSALPDKTTLGRARRSYHEENIIELFTKGRFQVRSNNQLYAKYTDIEGLFQHPALAVVDIDADGLDDLYVMGRWGKNQLLRNRGDGTFEDVAPAVGLDIEAFCNCALFADFDNDGDPDAFIGRSLERGLFLENQGGKFVDRSRDLVRTPMPHLISSISAADYNGDGLLDVYLSLYGPSSRPHSVKTWAPDFFPPQMVAAMEQRESRSHTYLERVGPPNLLLVNRGGTFAIAPEAEQLAEWLNTFQCSWADFDADGDQDAYICNDFAPDHLYRNDGEGEGGVVKFTEVSKQFAGEKMRGFGMGASWGDYDGDGKLDLYVSNMYSKAGKRITAAFDGLDERTAYSAQGSLLFHNLGDRFEQVAGTKANAMQVAKVGWSWGGQLVDLDNDGWPDIHAVSGFYTAPEELAPQIDL